MVDPLSLIVTSVGQAAGEAATKMVVDLLRDLVGAQSAEVRLLDEMDRKLGAIDRKVTRLLHAPLATGHRRLEDAVALWDQPEERRVLLREARSAFETALSQESDPLRRSFAAFHLSAVWLALGSMRHVQRYLDEAHAAALEALDLNPSSTMADWANDLAHARREAGVAPADAPLFVGVLPCRAQHELATFWILEAQAPRAAKVPRHIKHMLPGGYLPPKLNPEYLPFLRSEQLREVERARARHRKLLGSKRYGALERLISSLSAQMTANAMRPETSGVRSTPALWDMYPALWGQPGFCPPGWYPALLAQGLHAFPSAENTQAMIGGRANANSDLSPAERQVVEDTAEDLTDRRMLPIDEVDSWISSRAE